MAGETRVTSVSVEVLRNRRAPARVTSLSVETLRAEGPSEELVMTALSVQVAIPAPPPDLAITQAGVEVLAGGMAAEPIVTQAGVEAIVGGVADPKITQEGVEVLYRAVFTGCDTLPVFYRARFRVPGAGSDLAVFTSLPGGANPLLLEEPKIDAATIDVLKGASTIGGCTLRIIDAAARADCTVAEDPTDRAFTKILADITGESQALGLRVWVEATDVEVPDEGDWMAYWAGFVANVSFPDAITAEVTCAHSTRDDATTRVWTTTTWPGATFGMVAGGPILGTGWPSVLDGVRVSSFEGYWSMRTIGVYPTRVDFDIDEDASSGFVSGGVGASFPPSDLRPYLKDRGFIVFSNNDAQRNVFAWLNRNVQPYFAEGGPDPVTTAAWAATAPPIAGWFPRLSAQLISKNGSAFGPAAFPLVATPSYLVAPHGIRKSDVTRDLGNLFNLYWPAGGAVAQPAVNDVFTFYVRALDVSEANPLLFLAHPVDILTALWDALGIEYYAPSAAEVAVALGDFVLALRITKPMTLKDAQEMLCGAFGFGWRYDASGERYLFTTRVRPTPTGTITLSDLVSDEGVIWETDEGSRLYSASYTWKRFERWPGSEDPKNADRALDGVQQYDVGPIVFNTGETTKPYGSRDEAYDVPGAVLVLKPGGAAGEYVAVDTVEMTAALTEPLVAQFKRGGIQSTFDVGPDVVPLEGEDWNLDLSHRPGFDAGASPVAQRGLVELVQVISRVPRAWGSTITVIRVPATGGAIDDGVASEPPANTPIDESLTPSVSSTHVTLTIDDATNYAANSLRVQVAYAVQATAPTGDGTVLPAIWDVSAPYVFGPFLPGSKVWYRTRIVSTEGWAGAWTAWAFVTLTAGDGTTNTGLGMPTPTIILDIAAGVVAATVEGGPSAVKAYAAVSITGYPSTATTLAGATDSSVPFTFAALVTLAVGETAYVSVITEDALGNKSLRATASIERQQLAFGTVAVAGESDVVADAPSDTLTLVAGSNITITTNAGADSVTITSSAGGGTATLLETRYDPMCPPASPSAYDYEFETAGSGVPTGWTDVGALTPTVSIANRRLLMSCAANAGANAAAIEQSAALPSGAFTIYAHVGMAAMGAFNIVGLYVRNTTSGLIYRGSVVRGDSNIGNVAVQMEKYSSFTARTAFGGNSGYYNADAFLRLVYDGTTLYVQWSGDGVTWLTISSETASGYFTGGNLPDQMGIMLNSFSANAPAGFWSFFRYSATAFADLGRDVGIYQP